MLVGGVSVVEEGLNGRTSVLEDPLLPGRNGIEYLLPCLASHQPLDGVTIMLGTNDLKDRFGWTERDVAAGIGRLITAVKRAEVGAFGGSPRCLVIAPPHLQAIGPYADQFRRGVPASARLAAAIQLVATELGAEFLDAADYCETSSVDGIHLDVVGHACLGQAVAEVWRRWLSPEPA